MMWLMFARSIMPTDYHMRRLPRKNLIMAEQTSRTARQRSPKPTPPIAAYAMTGNRPRSGALRRRSGFPISRKSRARRPHKHQG